MNNNQVENGKRKQPDSVNFGIWMATLFVGHALGMAIAVGLTGLVLNIAPSRLLAPYALLVYCGLVLAPLLYWARLARQQPKSCARRFAIAMFLYLQVLLLAVGWSLIKLGILGPYTTLNDYAPFMLPISAIICIGTYIVARQMLEARES